MMSFEYSNAQVEKMIYEKFPYFSKGEKTVADYILSNFTSASRMSSSEVAENAGVSDTTVIRFARRLGFKGYLEFKRVLKNSAYTTVGMYEILQDMNLNADNEFAANYMLSAISDLQSFVQTLDYDLISEIARTLLDAEQVFVGGLGSDFSVAYYLYYYLRKMGFRLTLVSEDGNVLCEPFLYLTEKDAMIMCSYPKIFDGEREMARRTKMAGAKLITITNSDVDAAVLNGDYRIVITDQKRTFFNSYISAMAFCNVLLLKINELAPERVDRTMKAYIDAIRNRKMLRQANT